MVTPVLSSRQQQEGPQAAQRLENVIQDPLCSSSSRRTDVPDAGLNLAASWQVGCGSRIRLVQADST